MVISDKNNNTDWWRVSKTVTEHDVKTIAQENLVDYSCNPNNTEPHTLESEIEEITFIKSQILTLCKIIGNIAKASCE